MCGIFGCVGKNLEKSLADYCCDRLSHRGPDGRGVWQSDNVTLTHRRLSIIDLRNEANQPMFYENNRFVITFNGEIYNYLEIRKELIKKGYIFKTNSDTEVILASYSEWGEDCVSKFNGMWAFAIYDNFEHSLFLSRDRFGVKPLYYSIQNNNSDSSIIFASEMKAITPCLKQVKPNYKLINFYRSFHHYEFKESCLIEDIKRFPAGCNALYKNGNIKFSRYWNTLDHLIDVPNSYDEQVELLRELFIDSVRLRMRSDVSIGTSLSGGLDSSAVICTMSHISNSCTNDVYQNNWQHAYVATFENSKLDESVYAKKVTDYLGIDSTFLNIKNDLSENELLKNAYYLEELWLNSQLPQMKVYEQERLDGTVVSIDGHGADELFAGYETNMQFAFLDAVSDEEKTELFDIITNSSFLSKQKIPDEEKKKKVRRQYIKTVLKEKYENLYRNFIVKSDYVGHPIFNKLDHLTKSLCIEVHDKTLPTLLRNYDRDSMASGVEIRMPFMDYRVVSFAMSLKWNSKIRNGFSKAIVRDALQFCMPHDIAYRKTKIGFNAPISEWFYKYKDLYLSIVNDSSFINSSVVRRPRSIQKAINLITRDNGGDYIDKFNKAQTILSEINLYFWERAFVKNNIEFY